MSKHWYVVQARTNFEKSILASLNERIERSGMQAFFGQILVPAEEISELKDGVKKVSARKIYPGYIFIEMEMNDESWHLVKSTPKVTGFIGGTANKPAPISKKEIDKILQQVQEGSEKPKPKFTFENGEMIRIKEGPFTDFNGVVEDVNYDKNRLKISVTIFGRSTPVDLDFQQVEKV